MTYEIGSYTIKNRKYYNALLDAGITSNSELKKIDTNKDKIISEDELEELLLEDETDEIDETDDNSKKTGSSGGFSADVAESIALHEKEIRQLMQNLAAACSDAGTASDMDALNSSLSNVENIKNQIKEHREAIYELLTKEEGDTNVSGASSTVGVSSTKGVSKVSSVKNGKTIQSKAGTASKISDFAMQFEGKSQSEMQPIMTAAGNAYNWDQWCADFVTFCTRQTYGIDLLAGNTNTSGCCSGYGDWARNKGILMDYRENEMDLTKVKPGDYILYNDYSSSGYPYYHIGIVRAVHPESNTVDTIEGNADGAGNCRAWSGINVYNGGSRGCGASFVLVHNLLDD